MARRDPAAIGRAAEEVPALRGLYAPDSDRPRRVVHCLSLATGRRLFILTVDS